MKHFVEKLNSNNPETLWKMLEKAVGGLIENEICAYCKIGSAKDERCLTGEFCKSLILRGLLASIRRNA